MRKISTWAKAHKWLARIILVLSLLLLNITGILTGLLLKDLSVIIPGVRLLIDYSYLCMGNIILSGQIHQVQLCPRQVLYKAKKQGFYYCSNSFYTICMYK